MDDFFAGKSGNPGGRPKGVIGAKLLAQLLASDEENLLAIVEAVIAQARKGNTKPSRRFAKP